MEEKEWRDESSFLENAEDKKAMEKYIDASFILLSTMVNEKYSELDEKMKQFPSRVTNVINKNIIESSHRLYENICSENLKNSEELRRKILFRLNILIGIGGLIVILLFFQILYR